MTAPKLKQPKLLDHTHTHTHIYIWQWSLQKSNQRISDDLRRKSIIRKQNYCWKLVYTKVKTVNGIAALIFNSKKELNMTILISNVL